MEYSQTGHFTANQEKLCKEIASRLSKLHKSGCCIFGKGDVLRVYKTEDIEHAQPLHSPSGIDYNHAIKNLNAGRINDSGADDGEYFEQGYITEE